MTIDEVLQHARELQPDLWDRTEQIARIIDPAAFSTGWVVEPKEGADLHAARLKYMQSIAMSKAQEVLRFLGVNTDCDWYEILNIAAGGDR